MCNVYLFDSINKNKEEVEISIIKDGEKGEVLKRVLENQNKVLNDYKNKLTLLNEKLEETSKKISKKKRFYNK